MANGVESHLCFLPPVSGSQLGTSSKRLTALHVVGHVEKLVAKYASARSAQKLHNSCGAMLANQRFYRLRYARHVHRCCGCSELPKLDMAAGQSTAPSRRPG